MIGAELPDNTRRAKSNAQTLANSRDRVANSRFSSEVISHVLSFARNIIRALYTYVGSSGVHCRMNVLTSTT